MGDSWEFELSRAEVFFKKQEVSVKSKFFFEGGHQYKYDLDESGHLFVEPEFPVRK